VGVPDYTCFVKQAVNVCVISSTGFRNNCVKYGVGLVMPVAAWGLLYTLYIALLL